MSRTAACPSLQNQDCTKPEPLSCADIEVFWRVWLLHQEFLRSLSLRWMRGNKADAEDALSSAKLKAVIHYTSAPSSVLNERAWLSRLLYNACMDVYRRRACWDKTGDENLETFEVARELVRAPTPEDELVRRERCLELRVLMDRLPPAWRRAFEQKCLWGKTYEDISRDEQTTQANIRKRVQLARAFLRKQLVVEPLNRSHQSTSDASSPP